MYDCAYFGLSYIMFLLITPTPVFLSYLYAYVNFVGTKSVNWIWWESWQKTKEEEFDGKSFDLLEDQPKPPYATRQILSVNELQWHIPHGKEVLGYV